MQFTVEQKLQKYIHPHYTLYSCGMHLSKAFIGLHSARERKDNEPREKMTSKKRDYKDIKI